MFRDVKIIIESSVLSAAAACYSLLVGHRHTRRCTSVSLHWGWQGCAPQMGHNQKDTFVQGVTWKSPGEVGTCSSQGESVRTRGKFFTMRTQTQNNLPKEAAPARHPPCGISGQGPRQEPLPLARREPGDARALPEQGLGFHCLSAEQGLLSGSLLQLSRVS